MAYSSNSNKSGGIGCLGVIQIVLLLLKILSIEPVASWSWVWVFSPIWLPFAIVVGVILIFVLIKTRQN